LKNNIFFGLRKIKSAVRFDEIKFKFSALFGIFYRLNNSYSFENYIYIVKLLGKFGSFIFRKINN